jgi:ABC-type uncharacterized transport system substrate-binding protein
MHLAKSRCAALCGAIEGRMIAPLLKSSLMTGEGIPSPMNTANVAELVALAPDLILAETTASLTAALKATQTIPIVFVGVSDPIVQGFVANLAHPGGNATGFANSEFSIAGKWADLLKQIKPTLAHVALMFNPTTLNWGIRCDLIH